MRDFYGDLLCECEASDFDRIALTGADRAMVVTHVLATCVTCTKTFHADTDPHVEDLEREDGASDVA